MLLELRLVIAVFWGCPCKFHRVTGMSRLPVARMSCFGEKVIDQTVPICPSILLLRNVSVSISHSLIVSSEAPVPRILPSAEYARHCTGKSCACIDRVLSLRQFHSVTFPSPSPTAIDAEFGENWSSRIWRGRGRK